MAGENLVNRPKTLRTWLENFWYHYKYHTIVGAVVVVALAVILGQCATRTHYDYTVMLATSTVELSTFQVNALQKELASCGTDCNGDGEVNIVLVDCTFNEKTSGYQTIMAKKQKLQSMIVNEPQAMLLISDKPCLDWLNGLGERGFLEKTNLPDGNGLYYDMTDTSFVKKAKAAVGDEFVWPQEWLISRRRITDTRFSENKTAKKAALEADTFIQAVIQDGQNKK